jgi:CelD/BcsL family acetyltransferase involved in cellulose biosynthesis
LTERILAADTSMLGVKTQALAGAPASATLSVVTSLSALRDLEAKWRALEGEAQGHTSVFQSFDWVMAWAETYVWQKQQASLHILAGYDNDELVFLWPLMRTNRLGFAVLTWLSDPFGQYGDVICRKGHCSKQWIEGSVTFLKRLKDVDILRLRHVRADSHVATQATRLFSNARLPEKAPYLDLTAYPDEAAYDARYSSVQRRRRKKIRKSLEDKGPLAFKRLPAGSDADAAMQQAIAEKNQWLSDRGRINLVLGCPGHITFLKNLSRRQGGTVDVVVTELTAAGQPVSWEVGFRHLGTHYGYITSHVNALTDLSPGRLHMDLSQREALKDGMQRFDLMVPNDSHKESWSSAAVDTADYYLPLSLPGAAYGHGYVRTIRPLLRAIYYSLDAATLRKLNLANLWRGKVTASRES